MTDGLSESLDYEPHQNRAYLAALQGATRRRFYGVIKQTLSPVPPPLTPCTCSHAHHAPGRMWSKATMGCASVAHAAEAHHEARAAGCAAVLNHTDSRVVFRLSVFIYTGCTAV